MQTQTVNSGHTQIHTQNQIDQQQMVMMQGQRIFQEDPFETPDLPDIATNDSQSDSKTPEAAADAHRAVTPGDSVSGSDEVDGKEIDYWLQGTAGESGPQKAPKTETTFLGLTPAPHSQNMNYQQMRWDAMGLSPRSDMGTGAGAGTGTAYQFNQYGGQQAGQQQQYSCQYAYSY